MSVGGELCVGVSQRGLEHVWSTVRLGRLLAERDLCGAAAALAELA